MGMIAASLATGSLGMVMITTLVSQNSEKALCAFGRSFRSLCVMPWSVMQCIRYVVYSFGPLNLQIHEDGPMLNIFNLRGTNREGRDFSSLFLLAGGFGALKGTDGWPTTPHVDIARRAIESP